MARKIAVGSRIKKWLENEGFKVELPLVEKFDFVLEIKDPSGKGTLFSISKPAEADVIGISSGVRNPQKEIVDVFKKLEDGDKIQITQAMHRELLKMVQDHHIEKNLVSVDVTERIYPENLNRQKFMDSFIRVRNAQLYLVSAIRNRFGGQVGNPPSTLIHPMYR